MTFSCIIAREKASLRMRRIRMKGNWEDDLIDDDMWVLAKALEKGHERDAEAMSGRALIYLGPGMLSAALNADKFKQIQLKNTQKTIIKKSIRPLKLFFGEGFLHVGNVCCLPLPLPSLSGAHRANDRRFALERFPPFQGIFTSGVRFSPDRLISYLSSPSAAASTSCAAADAAPSTSRSSSVSPASSIILSVASSMPVRLSAETNCAVNGNGLPSASTYLDKKVSAWRSALVASLRLSLSALLRMQCM